MNVGEGVEARRCIALLPLVLISTLDISEVHLSDTSQVHSSDISEQHSTCQNYT